MSTTPTQWLINNKLADGFSPLGEATAAILHDALGGVYNLSEKQLKMVNWKNDHHTVFVYDRELCNVDGDRLLRLIVMSHDRAIRVSLRGRANGYIEIMFHQRDFSGTNFYERIQPLDEAIQKVRKIPRSATEWVGAE